MEVVEAAVGGWSWARGPRGRRRVELGEGARGRRPVEEVEAEGGGGGGGGWSWARGRGWCGCVGIGEASEAGEKLEMCPSSGQDVRSRLEGAACVRACVPKKKYPSAYAVVE